MRTRKLGNTGLEISCLGFGAGGYWGMPFFDEGVARSLVDIALERGVSAFDTGPNYSRANAEPRLGRVLGRRVVRALRDGPDRPGARVESDARGAHLDAQRLRTDGDPGEDVLTGGLGERRCVRGDERVARQIGMAGESTDAQTIAKIGDAAQSADAADVDEAADLAKAQVEAREQAS